MKYNIEEVHRMPSESLDMQRKILHEIQLCPSKVVCGVKHRRMVSKRL